MPVYKAPVEDTLFVLNDVLGIEKYNNLPGFADATSDLVEAIAGEAAKLSEEVLFPLNLSGDQEGCTRHEDGSVTPPKGFKQAYDKYCEGGWLGLAAPEAFGGQGLPYTLHTAVGEYMSSANMALMMYPGLTNGAIAAILVHGSEEQKRTYLPNMIAGTWSGTMNLTEPHCGTDLGLLRTKAVLQPDGTYKISGQKIFISAGEHDMTDNIIHLVLARIEGAPEGTKGISLFIVPKFILDADGRPGRRNGVSCGAIERKMGIHGNATCVVNHDGATGYLIGEENRGLAAMFVMMNGARLGVGMQGLGLTEIAYQNSLAYAKDRIQMRSLSGPKAKDKPADPIIVHPDVRRLLLTQKAYVEGGRAFAYWVGLQIDREHAHPDEAVRKEASDLVALLTPVIKAFLTDNGFECTNLGLQVFGGHGYVKEWGMEQYVRDARINLIYEGTNGVQALDLLGRKVLADMGAKLQKFGKMVGAFVKSQADKPEMAEFTGPLAALGDQVTKLTMEIGQKAMKNPEEVGAASTPYLRVVGHLVFAYFWARMARLALDKKDSGDKFYTSKLATARFYYAKLLPETEFHLKAARAGAASLMELEAELF